MKKIYNIFTNPIGEVEKAIRDGVLLIGSLTITVMAFYYFMLNWPAIAEFLRIVKGE